MSTLRELLDADYSVHVFHESLQPYCSHYFKIDLAALIERFGEDFDLFTNRAWFLSRCKCSRCGAVGKNMNMHCTPNKTVGR